MAERWQTGAASTFTLSGADATHNIVEIYCNVPSVCQENRVRHRHTRASALSLSLLPIQSAIASLNDI